MVLVVSNDTIRLCGIWPLEKNARGSDDDIVTQEASVWSVNGLDGLDRICGANTCETGAWRFPHVAHPQRNGKQTQKLIRAIAIVTDDALDLLVESKEQVLSVEETAAYRCLDLKGVLPVHRFDPTIHIANVAVGEEPSRECIHAGNANRSNIPLSNLTYMLEFREIVRVREQDAHVVGIRRDAGMRIVESR